MKDQAKENEIYTVLGQFLVDSLIYESLEGNWDKVIFRAMYTHDVIKFKADCVSKEEVISMKCIPEDIEVWKAIKDLHAYSIANNYAPWNRFTFELTPGSNFNIEYIWDQDLHNEYVERYGSNN